MPSRVNNVIVGGGIMGCSIAYHLSLAKHQENILLIEQNTLTSGTTWHAAGLVSQRRGTAEEAALVGETIKQFEQFEANDMPIGWLPVGSLSVVRSDAGIVKLKQQHSQLTNWGIECSLLTPKECKDIYPLLNDSYCAQGLWLPNDGVVNPTDICMLYAKLAKENGVQFIEKCKLTGSSKELSNKRIRALQTTHGLISVDQEIILATGRQTRSTAKCMGILKPPSTCVAHQYVSVRHKEMKRHFPIIRFLDDGVYLRPESGGASIGQFHDIPAANEYFESDEPYHLFPTDENNYLKSLLAISDILPCIKSAEIGSTVNGPDIFSATGQLILGKTEYLHNVWLATGWNSHGIMLSGGVGKYIADSIVLPRKDVLLSKPSLFKLPSMPEMSDQECVREARKFYSAAYPIS